MSHQFEDALKNDKIYDFLNNYTKDQLKTRNKESKSPLMLACANKSGEGAKLILRKFAAKKFTPEEIDLEGADSEGWTAFHHAAKSGCLETIKLLLHNGAIIDATT